MSVPSSYIPDFELKLSGRPIPAELRARVSRVRFDESLQAADMVQVEFADPGHRYLDDRIFDITTEIEISLGYRPRGLQSVFVGNVTSIEPTFPQSGMPTITITAHDFMQRLTRGTKDRCFPYYVPDAVIAAIVAVENQLIPAPDPASLALTGAIAALGRFNGRPMRYQHRKSDYDFLRGIATEYGMEMWVDEHVLNFKLLLPFLPAPEVELRWGESLVDFAPRLTSIGQILAVRAHVWVDALKTQLGIEVGWDGERLSARVVPAAGQMGTGVAVELPDVPFDNPMEAIKRAIAEMKRRVNGRVTGRGTAVGNPAIRAGNVIALAKVGRFSGRNYRLTSVSHTIDSGGYRTGFEVRQEWL
jgi:phage protein D